MKKPIRLRELKLKQLRFKRLRYRTLLIALGVVATVVLAFNFWFIDHAEEALEQIVHRQSKGKLNLKVKSFKFNWIKNKIELHEASIFSTDTTAATSYAVNTKKISIKARGFLPLLFNREILIDSIRLIAPNVIFTRHRARVKNKDTTNVDNSSFSVAVEMGRISKSMSDAINVLQVDKFRLDNGSFSLVDKTKSNETPFAVTNIFVQLDNLQLDSSTGGRSSDKITFTDNIAVRTFNQNIAFPGGRHFIAFKDFRVDLQRQRVEFDSCTLRAVKGDSSKTAFRIFFDKLQLTNINFDSLYSSETIIADSVFCNRPQIFLDIDSDKSTGKNKKKKGRQERIDGVIQQLLGDMKLGYVGVKNASIDVNTIRKGRTSTFSSRDNNFDMYGLVVIQDDFRPISLDKFVMSLHNYENVIRDGRYAISFDSIRFEDDVIMLSKFSFKEFDRGRTIKSLSMPNFQVRGLSWEALLYDNIFSAQSAVFYDPKVNYTLTRNPKKNRSKNLFETLNNVDDVMDLKNLGIHRGDLRLNFHNGASLHLTNTHLDLRANELTGASRIKSVQRSVNALSFDKGTFQKGDLTAYLNQVHLSENKSGLTASSLLLHSDHVEANARNIHIGTVVLDSVNQSILIDGVNWGSATLDMTTGAGQPAAPKKKTKTPLVLRNIRGTDTRIAVTLPKNRITGTFHKILLQEFTQNAAGQPEVKGLSLDGQDVLMQGPDLRVAIGQLDIQDKNHSVLKDIQVEKINNVDSIIAVVPKLTIIPNITEIVSGNLTLQGLVVTEPSVYARLGKKDHVVPPSQKKATRIQLGTALLERPDITLSIVNTKDSVSLIRWDGVQRNSFLKVTDFLSTPQQPVTAAQIKMFLTNFEFVTAKGRKYATNDNKLNIELNDVWLEKGEDQKMNWRTNLNILSLDRLAFDSLGKDNAVLELDRGDIRNVALNSKYVGSIGDIITNSDQLSINGTNGKFATAKNTLLWYGFTVRDRVLGVDSFSLVPKQSVESYRIGKAFNEDYLRIKTGRITGGPIDLKKFSDDSILSIGHIELNDVDLFTFKDKTQPDTAKRYKPLPAEMLLKLKSSLSIDSINLNRMKVTYWEVNPGTDSLGAIDVTDLNVLMRNIKNYDIQPEDSIYILASARVLNRLYTTLDVAQSYSDTTGFMRMNLETGPMDLTRFNTVLVPLVGAKVFRGDLKSLRVDAVGTNDAAVGSAYMHYDALKLGLLNKKDLPHQTGINKLVSWVAMTFVIRNHNRGKTSPVFFERWQEKSPINYIIKTTLEGIKSSIGLPGAKKKLRQYRKRQKGQNK